MHEIKFHSFTDIVIAFKEIRHGISWKLTCQYGDIPSPKVVTWYTKSSLYGAAKFVWMATGGKTAEYNQAEKNATETYAAQPLNGDSFSRYHSIELANIARYPYHDIFYTCSVVTLVSLDLHKSETKQLNMPSELHHYSPSFPLTLLLI